MKKSSCYSSFFTVLVIAAFFMGITSCASQGTAVKVSVVKQGDKYRLLRNGKSYVIKGAGIEVSDFEAFALHGGNSVRNWTTQNSKETTLSILNKAHSLGLTVSLCLSLAKEHWGFDYNDEAAVRAQYEKMRAEVIKYKDHPALLTWIIGNELNFNYTNPKVYDAVNDISKMIHEIDPNHPTTTTLAGLDKKAVKDIQQRATDLDFISFQVYGQLAILPKTIKEINYDKPFMVTEWGTIGFWEMPKTKWGAPIELNSSDKALNTLTGYQKKLQKLDSQLIGDYVFLWGQKQERTPTWFGMFTEFGHETESVDVMHYIWNGKWPSNRVPAIESMILNSQQAPDSIELQSNKYYTAQINASDPDGDALTYKWEIKPESDSKKVGGDFEEGIKSLNGIFNNASSSSVEFAAPKAPGAYRLFVYVFDGHNNAGHANIPFLVKN
ncbi:MAG: hypothetical protein HWE27_06795 [Gammaproteobacteria bacterium]|nr:hypothetical protein [Gammaproteobacteria bacterium]